MRRYAMLMGPLALMLVVSASCSKTNLVSSWKDAAYGGYLESVLLVMVSDNVDNRRVFEETFVEAFTSSGVEAVSSLSVIPDGNDIDDAVIIKEASTRGMKAIYVSNLVSVGDKVIYRPSPTAHSSGAPGLTLFSYDYQHLQDYANQAGYYRHRKYVKLESKIYETATEKVIWSMSSETIEPQSVNKAIQSLSRAVMKNLKRHGLIE
jgi:hypothetical protein